MLWHSCDRSNWNSSLKLFVEPRMCTRRVTSADSHKAIHFEHC